MNTKKSLFCALLALLLSLLAIRSTYAMGVLQGNADYIPTPATDIGFTIIDTLGIRTAVKHGSIDGKDYIAGYNGLILNVIPFNNIVSVSFTKTTAVPEQLGEKLGSSPLTAVIHLKDRTVLHLTVDGSLLCYGRTPYGYIRVKLLSLYGIEDIKILKKDTLKKKESGRK